MPPTNYRGRRRLPKLPSRRYAAVVTTAMLGAAAVALVAGALVPRAPARGNPYDDPAIQAVSMQDRLNATDLAARAEDGPGPPLSVGQAAPVFWVLPLACSYVITTKYEMRWGAMHWGYDLACPMGTPIHAVADGTVVKAGYDEGGYGNEIMIDHGAGIVTIYGHASSLKAHLGDKVKAGDVVSYVGSTGESTGDHLHFEVRINNEHTNPYTFMLAHGVDLQKKLQAVNGDTIVS